MGFQRDIVPLVGVQGAEPPARSYAVFPQQFLYFLPEPHGQGSLRPIFPTLLPPDADLILTVYFLMHITFRFHYTRFPHQNCP